MQQPRGPILRLVVLRVSDLERAAAFYALCGLKFEKHAHGTGPEHMASEQDGVVFELYPATQQQPLTASARIGFAVPALHAVVDRVRGMTGARVVSEPAESEWGTRAVVADPDGHRVELYSVA